MTMKTMTGNRMMQGDEVFKTWNEMFEEGRNLTVHEQVC